MLFGAGEALAASSCDAEKCQIDAGTSLSISGPDGQCYVITNPIPNQPIFVPIKSIPEWQAFYTILPRNSVSKSNCYSYGQSGYYSYGQSGYYGYGQSGYYSYGQSGYYGYGQSGYYSYGQSGYYGYTYGQSGYYAYSYGQSGYYGYTYGQSGYYSYGEGGYYSYGEAGYYSYGEAGYYSYGEAGYYGYSYGEAGYYGYSYGEAAYGPQCSPDLGLPCGNVGCGDGHIECDGECSGAPEPVMGCTCGTEFCVEWNTAGECVDTSEECDPMCYELVCP